MIANYWPHLLAMLGPRLGGMTMVALVIAVTPTRLLGAGLLLAGALLVVRR